MQVNTIVVGVDGSDNAQRAIDAAVSSIAEGGTIHVVTAFDAPSAHKIQSLYQSVPEEFRSTIDLLSGPRQAMHDARFYVVDKGVECVEHFVDDDPASAILGVAEMVGADLVVIGSRGLGRAAQMLRGSVSTKIAHHCTSDFLVIH